MLYAIGNKNFTEGLRTGVYEEMSVMNLPKEIQKMLNPISNRSYDAVDLTVHNAIGAIIGHLNEHEQRVNARRTEIDEWVDGVQDEFGKVIPRPVPIEKCDGVLITEDLPIYFHYHLVMYLRREGVPVYYVYRRPIWKDVDSKPTNAPGTSEIVSEIVDVGNASLMDFNPVKRS